MSVLISVFLFVLCIFCNSDEAQMFSILVSEELNRILIFVFHVRNQPQTSIAQDQRGTADPLILSPEEP